MVHGHVGPDMVTVHFRDDAEPIETERAFIAENGWVALTGEEQSPVMFPSDRIDRVEGSDDTFYDTAVLTEEVGSRHVDETGRVLQEPELVRRMVTELEIY
ncbi:hypothetical protein [Haloarchaeobius sp. HRN-SO-5]|uniref:hypothetical protein n=1 Tax=Haloarchaeobius sp. HRN-SO-5 TaxID=3446118 RepID=UPI003EB9D96A